MADDSPQRHYNVARETLTRKHENGELSTEDYEQITEYLDTWDESKPLTPSPEGEDTKAYSTLKNHTATLQNFTLRLPCDLTDADADDVNTLLQQYLNGDHPDVKDGGYAENTVKVVSGTVRGFFDMHDEYGIEKGDIFMPSGKQTKVDERDMFTTEEVQSLRDATENVRNAALLDMFLYTGQRVTAIRTLRIKDIDVDGGAFYLNETVDGLKGAEGKRPMLGAEANVREWLQYHPCKDDPEAAVFTALPSHPDDSIKGEPLHRASISRILSNIGDRAGVDKPLNPHNFRHFFVTSAKKQYGLDDSEIKHLIGHRADSTVMETTYSHLTDDDVIENVEVKAGFREPSEESSLSPPQCPTCKERLPENAKACPRCGMTFTPDAQSARDEIRTDMAESKGEARGANDEYGEQASEKLEQLVDENPELLSELITELSERTDET